MEQKCPKCSSVCDAGSNFCEKCGHSLVSMNKPIPQNGKSNKKLLKAIAVLGILGVLVAAGTYLVNSNSLKGEWYIYEEYDTFKVTIPNNDELVLSYMTYGEEGRIDVYYDIQKPQSKNEPYSLSQPLKAEVIISISSLEDEDDIEEAAEIGFIIETKDDQYVMRTEDSRLIDELTGFIKRFYFYEVNDRLEIIYANDEGEEVLFLVALPNQISPEEGDYIKLFEDVLDELKTSDLDRPSLAKENLAEIKKIAPDSKLLVAYSELNKENDAFLAAAKNKDKAKLQEIKDKIAEMPLSQIGGLYQHYIDSTNILLERISQAEIFD
ncbi:zinc ribbon domain-containing protein [Jeotgalibaca arthritidis]|uniref:Zinc ribbon domain-containing protein n=1 Tax=Jeotgalibaca arthritidis TaxID=1868794 RepID=A0A6G7KAV6_9LACT|nr:zinc ribbon domain-containing protein [Jeotgalibaca arthritidis]QII82399.1 zinc ribbon domain-containing protein [Jeotgalibaca arthritidis]